MQEIEHLRALNEELKAKMVEEKERNYKAVFNENVLGELYWWNIIDAEGNILFDESENFEDKEPRFDE